MIDKGRADEVMGAFEGKKILVIGDLMLDRYVTGTVSRISPEAPVPVLRVTDEHCKLGGAANVALNIRSLGGDAVLAGLVGDDDSARELLDLVAGNGISTDGICSSSDIRTTVKTRVVAERQQVVRVDREDIPEKATSSVLRMVDCISKIVSDVDGVVIEDYGKGAITQELVDAVLKSAAIAGVPVGLDPKDYHDLKIEGIKLATPNYKEACSAAGVKEVPLTGNLDDDTSLMDAGRILLDRWKSELLIITLGAHGMCLIRDGEEPHIVPTKAREVFDVSGAGDTVIATAMLALVSGADNYEAIGLANSAAGVVVAKLGTATCDRQELLKTLK